MARDPNPQRIWLTGATSGIGEALARRLLDDGHRVALTSRGKAGLERLAKDHENAMPVPADMTARRCRTPPHASTRPSTASTW